MLARNWRFGIQNDIGVALGAAGAVIKARRWKGSSDGTVAFEASEAVIYSNAASIGSGSYQPEDNVDNSADEYEGGAFELTITIGTGTPTGDITVYYEVSTDAGGTWPDANEGSPVCVLNITATGTFVKTFQL